MKRGCPRQAGDSKSGVEKAPERRRIPSFVVVLLLVGCTLPGFAFGLAPVTTSSTHRLSTGVTLIQAPSRTGGTPGPNSRVLDRDRLQTAKGEVRVSETALSLGSEILLRAEGGFWSPVPRLAAVAPNAAAAEVILIEFGGGTACPATYRLLDLQTSPPTLTREFGTCSDLPVLAVTDGSVTVTMPSPRGPGRWRYARGRAGRPGTLTEERRGR